MRLQGRELHAGMAGEDVIELHSDLVRLGYRLPEDEVRDGIFGMGTARAVGVFQKAYGLLDTAVVEAGTAAAFTRALAVSAPVSGNAIPLPVPRP